MVLNPILEMVAHCGFESLPDYDCKCDGDTQKTQILRPTRK